jgi:hypothetical protein
MKKLFALAAALSLAACQSPAASTPGAAPTTAAKTGASAAPRGDLFPLDAKTTWQYARDRMGALTLKIAKLEKASGYTLATFGAGVSLKKYADHADLIQPGLATYRLYQEPMAEGATWTYAPYPDGDETVEATVEAVEDLCLGVGVVRGCYRVKHRSVELGDSTIWIAPGVGIAKSTGAFGRTTLSSMTGLKIGTTTCK